VAEVGAASENDQLYRLTYDGSIDHEPRFLVMGGQTDPIATSLKETYREDLDLADAVGLAVQALKTSAPATTPASNGNGDNGGIGKLEVAVLERGRPRRAFRRIEGAALSTLLPSEEKPEEQAADTPDKPVTDVELPGDDA
jgi:proteasome alpha subunit